MPPVTFLLTSVTINVLFGVSKHALLLQSPTKQLLRACFFITKAILYLVSFSQCKIYVEQAKQNLFSAFHASKTQQQMKRPSRELGR